MSTLPLPWEPLFDKVKDSTELTKFNAQVANIGKLYYTLSNHR